MASWNIMNSEIITPDIEFEQKLRPSRFSDFTGQDKIRERLELFVQAAKERHDVLDHVLLCGPPGLGKTTLSYILADAMDANIKCTSGPVIDKPSDLAGLLTSLERGDVLFIDEIHRMQRSVEEYLYSAMEDFVIDIVIDQGPNARSVRLNVPPFTLIGATTRSGMLSAPMRSRFGLINRLDYYDPTTLATILQRSAHILNVELKKDGAIEIARRARGTPRIANNLLRRARDFAQVKANNIITADLADKALNLLDIDGDGLEEMDKRLLTTLIEKFNGGPVGLNSLSVSVGEEADTLEEVYEPYLIQEGFLKRTSQGRVATDRAYAKFGLTPPERT
jgi:Holliday junction DNA helicase RuvB